LGIFAIGEAAGALEHEVHAEITPRKPLGVALTEVDERSPVDNKLAAEDPDLPLVASVDSVYLSR
jgi:hypothetical protein